jgi:GMP synthase-like glutamine amidotransferase
VLSHKPDGIFLSNGPGDPAATGKYAVPVIKQLMDTGKPMFGICLGHQMLGLALGGKTDEDASGPPRRQPSGEGPHHRQGRDHLDEPRLRGRPRRCPPA